MVALQTKKGVPFEFLEYRICKEFGWTLTELEVQPWNKIELILDMMNMEQQFQKRDQRLMEQKHASKR